MTEIEDLRRAMVRAQATYLEAQHKYVQAQWRLFNFRFKEYEERAKAYNEKAHEDTNLEAWFREVRPMCRDCRQEITDIYSGHSVNVSWGELPWISCGKRDNW